MADYDTNHLCFVTHSPVHGRGLFARQDIPVDTWIGHYDGPQTQQNDTHVLWVEAESDAHGSDDTEAAWIGYDGNNELRFLNHAAQPNGEMDGLDLYANRNIVAGEEITIDYGEDFEAAA